MKSHRKAWLIAGGSVLLAALAGLLIATSGLNLKARNLAIANLREAFQSDVDLANLEITLFPLPAAHGEGLVLRHNGRTDVPPLISIHRFSVRATPLGILRKRIRSIRVDGLEIHVPPRQAGGEQDSVSKRGPPAVLVVEELTADGAMLRILPKKPGKKPLEFEMHNLKVHGASADQAMTFDAVLTNAKPPGHIITHGRFGPWAKGDPGSTPVSGSYNFAGADLSVFKGIAGILSSNGNFNGLLSRIEADGSTDTPDFRVRTSGKPVHLKTEFHAVIDGTDGDTLLQPVTAQFLRSSVTARGGVYGKAGEKGKTVSLDVSVTQARIEDLMRLAVKSEKAVMTGAVAFQARLDIPPGNVDVVDKLNLKGSFGVRNAEFSDKRVQDKVETLSQRARGETDEDVTESVVSNLSGTFAMSDATIRFSNLSFGVPGASVRLKGAYGLNTEEIDFRGTLRMQAKVSETTTGIKSFLLKAVDPFLKKDGAGSVVPIKITGTRKDPSFGLNLGGS